MFILVVILHVLVCLIIVGLVLFLKSQWGGH